MYGSVVSSEITLFCGKSDVKKPINQFYHIMIWGNLLKNIKEM